MKSIPFIVLLFPVFCAAQDNNNQRYQLFQGKFVEITLTLHEKTEKSFEFQSATKDTVLFLMKIDTETGDVWHLEKSSTVFTRLDNVIKSINQFGWVFVGDIDSTVFVADSTLVIKPAAPDPPQK